jgi:hypothetical protein
MSTNTVAMLKPSDLEGKKPTADSSDSASNITAWNIEGKGSRRMGNGGIPMDMEDLERNTVV